MGHHGSTVLVIGSRDDPTATVVVDELARRSRPARRMDIGDFPSELGLTGKLLGGRWNGELGDVRFAEIESVYYRRPSRFTFPHGLSPADLAFASEEARLGVSGVLTSLDVPWVNNPAKIAVAEYKPLQLRTAARCGLSVPSTLITTDHRAVIDFADAVGPLVCKTLSSLAHSVDGKVRITYTTAVDPGVIDPTALAVTAHLFQSRVPKQYEVRVTMVGKRALGVAIHAGSAAARLDWRADYAALSYAPIDVPSDVVGKAVTYLDAFGLAFGAFDFVVTPEDEWVFLECNPAGQWLWLERQAGIPITAALVDLLTGEVTE
ncbi:ATP-grasp ribosomal peptide maturase [Actinokineospora pegani]|uniref:ATP-grasp ribosomal peptide maturase n=1 Tax=Actinokineospora pegani TaxID=2654637 RepID=UPI0012EAA84C|nr:ATP-grasp ribosomal peptide maturase [Actinokineospora pegani]